MQERPSDEAILNFENSIREEQVYKNPLVSVILPTSLLIEEYSHSPGHLTSIHEIVKVYPVMRRIRGDGNCFFRSFSFAFIELLVKNNDIGIEGLRGEIDNLLSSVGFDKMAYEDFHDELYQTITDYQKVNTDSKSNIGEWLCSEWQVNSHRSHSIVVLMRLIASAYLRLHEAEYSSFIEDDSVVNYCQKYVECMGVESDNIHIIALSKALQVDIKVVCLADGPTSTFSFTHSDDSIQLQGGKKEIHLLYRPGHYDLLYTL